MRVAAILRRASVFVIVLFVIEFLDELVGGAREAAWPLMRDDLGLSYAEVGLLLGLPMVFGNLVEPFLGVLFDVWRKRALVVGGGLIFAAALLLTALSGGFWMLLPAFLLLNPASGAFVSLSQATLMDLAPARREQNMARWVVAGGIGVVVGPLVLGVFVQAGAGWRALFAFFAALTLVLVWLASRQPFPDARPLQAATLSPGLLKDGLLEAVHALRRPNVARWLTLLEFSDLLQDVLLGFLALYLVDVGQATPAQASLAVAVWSAAALLGGVALVPLLERWRGLRLMRWTAAISALLYPLFLLAGGFETKLALLALLGFSQSGWYAVLKAQLYATLPGQSGTALATANFAGLIGGLIPVGLGLLAQSVGLAATMWLLLLGPVVLLLGLPRRA